VTIEVQRGYAKGRAKRKQILEAAMALFGEVGYRSASLREIAARCGLSHPGLLHHFASKELLLSAVLEHRDAVDSDRYALTAGSGVEQLGRLVDLVAHNAEVPGIVELYAALSTEAVAADHPAHAFFVRRYAQSRARMTNSFTLAEAQGALRPGIRPEQAAVVLIAVMDGLQVQWLLDRRSVDMATTLRAHLADLLTVPLPGATGPRAPTPSA
jgi:AcrR family transcriptional regulator